MDIGALQQGILEGILVCPADSVIGYPDIDTRRQTRLVNNACHPVCITVVDHGLQTCQCLGCDRRRILHGLGSKGSLIIDPAVCRQGSAASVRDITGSVIARVLDHLTRGWILITVDRLEIFTPFSGLNIHAL